MLASWVHSLRQGRTILNEEQKQILDVMGFAWDIDEIYASKRQNMALEVCLIVILLSLSYNFTNFSQMNRSAFKMLKVIIHYPGESRGKGLSSCKKSLENQK